MPAVSKKKNELASGQVFGHYEILRQIGAGGMGEVYLARDNKLDRKVAVKILNAEFEKNESNLQRFIREAKAASALNHPNILVVHEIGESDGSHYIVSEYIEGKTLREVLREKSLNLAEILDVAVQIAGALNAAHKAHLVHRDIKPENIVIRPDRFVKVLDFGLAKLVEQKSKSLTGAKDETAKQNNTAQGVILGTVNYMSPEQAKGERVDQRTDIFSFGATVYEMIAGRTPFAGDSVSETFANLIKAEPLPLVYFAPNVPDELQRIVSKTLRKNKDARYKTMSDALTDLRELKENLAFDEKLERSAPRNENATAAWQATTGGVNLQTAETGSDSLSQKIRRNPFAAIVPLVLLAVAAIGFGVWYLSNRGAKQIESIAVMPFVNERGNADIEYLSDGMTETLIRSLSSLSNLNVKPRSSVFRYKGKDTNLQTIAKELNVHAILNGRVVQRGDGLTLSLELVDVSQDKVIWAEQYQRKTSDLVSLQSEVARDVLSKLKIRLTGADEQKLAKKSTENAEAYQLYIQGRYEWNKFSFDSLKKSIPLFERAIEKDPIYALAYSGLADSYVNLGVDYISAHDTMPQARVAAIQAIALDDSLAEAHTSLGSYKMFYDWDLTGAEDEYRKAISLDAKYGNARHFYSHCLQFSGREAEAISEMKTAVELEPLSLVNNSELGWAYYLANQHDAAIEQLNKTVKLDPTFSNSYFLLGLVYADKGNYAEAVAALREGQRLSPDWLELQAVLAYTYASAGERGAAEALLTKLLKSAADTYVNPVLIAGVYVALADNDRAIAWLERGYREKCSWMSWIAIEPQLERLRPDPRFRDLVSRVKR